MSQSIFESLLGILLFLANALMMAFFAGLAALMANWLKENGAERTIVPFVTRKGSGFGSSMGMIEDLVFDADVYTGGWYRAGDLAHAEETRQDAAAWAETVLLELE